MPALGWTHGAPAANVIQAASAAAHDPKPQHSLDLNQGCPTGSSIFCAMIDQEPRQPKKETETKPPRLEEIRRNLEDYANDLREIIKKFRRKLDS
jgi:hypothetical protein